jgi:hypothetical protein
MDNTLTVVGLMGAAESGKNTAATLLSESLATNFDTVVEAAFATLLKQAVYELDPVIGWSSSGGIRVSGEVDRLGWDEVKKTYPEARRLLQRMGTEVGRNLFGNDFWVTSLGDNVKSRAAGNTLVLITDVRFENEVEFIKSELGGMVIHLSRAAGNSLGDEAKKHASEQDLSHLADAEVHNNGTLEELRDSLIGAVSEKFPEATSK